MPDKTKEPEPPIEAAAGLLALEIVTMLLAHFTSTGLVDRESIRAAPSIMASDALMQQPAGHLQLLAARMPRHPMRRDQHEDWQTPDRKAAAEAASQHLEALWQLVGSAS